MSAAPMPDLSNAEPVEWEIEGRETKTRVRIKEGATMEIRLIVTGVLRNGNDPLTGLPRYHINTALGVSMVNCDKKLRKAALKQPGPGEGTATAGVA